MTKIVKSFGNNKSSYEVEHETGTKITLSWEHLKGYLEVAGGLNEDDQLDGVIIGNDITLKISKKYKQNFA